MNVKINSVHFKADRKLEAFIQEKVSKLTQYFDGIVSADVMLKLDNNETPENKIAEIKLSIPGNDLYAKKQSKTFEEATDEVVDALKVQLKKYKEKLRGL
ncbi:MAG: putative sigma-54 modulation protein [Bacteroidales bacterium]|jgi:putative sigma-54 modulation protein|nr:putative sigma-54 modulation protein [Bacteroidales bacterium]MDN5329092.1 putative sigma-54 modulation protein [Bacteroidales bacterium]NLH53455.1 ribosome-associated translation inhibitor RaiA [Bacteroidales bacterium]NPV36644.1 ribosome-associated translation inhibitor RaiA [Bacteroidales bacterium]